MKLFSYQSIWFIVIFLMLSTERSIAFQMSDSYTILKHLSDAQISEKHESAAIKLQMELWIQFYDTSQSASSPQKTDPHPLSSDNESKRLQMDLIQARILSRKGLYPDAKALYRQLLRRYPQSRDVRADYIEVLVEQGEYDDAFYEIEHLLSQDPTGLRGRRMIASLYDRMQLPTWSFSIYEKLIERYPNDSGIWFDYANQRSLAGHWQNALHAYEHVLENAPDNIYALRGIHSILREKQPAVKTQFFRYESSDGTLRTHQQYAVRYTLTKHATLHARYENTAVHTPENVDIANETMDQQSIEMTIDIHPHFRFVGRYQAYQGLGNGISGYGSFEYHDQPQMDCQISYLIHFPWFDPIQAMDADGYYNDFQVSIGKSLPGNIRVNTSIVYRTYSLNTISNYGHRSNYQIGLSRRLWLKPDTTLSLTMDQAKFSYASDHQNVPMVLNERVYALSAYIQDQPNTVFSYTLSFGYRWDIQRSLAGFYINPGVGCSLTSQFQINTSYAYSSESTGIVSGSTQSIQMDMNIIF
ncbi:MAG: tetratricopeptide repeat protein [Candidatus Magnetomorum sp.]|nr:tetratricopeptide repeat protein [Candidatus Magnetomorum sp.]